MASLEGPVARWFGLFWGLERREGARFFDRLEVGPLAGRMGFDVVGWRLHLVLRWGIFVVGFAHSLRLARRRGALAMGVLGSILGDGRLVGVVYGLGGPPSFVYVEETVGGFLSPL